MELVVPAVLTRYCHILLAHNLRQIFRISNFGFKAKMLFARFKRPYFHLLQMD